MSCFRCRVLWYRINFSELVKILKLLNIYKCVLAKQASTAGLGALLYENNHGCRRASAFTYLLLIWIRLFKLRLSVSAKNAYIVVKYVMRVRTSTAFTSKVFSFPVLWWQFHFHAYIYLPYALVTYFLCYLYIYLSNNWLITALHCEHLALV